MENPSKVKVLLLKVNSCYPTPGGLGSALSGIPLNCINWLCFSFTYSFFLGARKSLITVKCYCRARERELQGIYNRDACFQRPVNEAFVSSGHTSPRLWCPLTPFRPSCPTPEPPPALKRSLLGNDHTYIPSSTSPAALSICAPRIWTQDSGFLRRVFPLSLSVSLSTLRPSDIKETSVRYLNKV